MSTYTHYCTNNQQGHASMFTMAPTLYALQEIRVYQGTYVITCLSKSSWQTNLQCRHWTIGQIISTCWPAYTGNRKLHDKLFYGTQSSTVSTDPSLSYLYLHAELPLFMCPDIFNPTYNIYRWYAKREKQNTSNTKSRWWRWYIPPMPNTCKSKGK